MLQSLSLPSQNCPSWIRYARDLLARQNAVLVEEAAFASTLPAQQAARVVDPDWPADSKTGGKEDDNIPGTTSVAVARRPLPAAQLLLLMRLARTFGSAPAFEAQLTDHRLTLLRGFAIPDLPHVARTIGKLMLPEGWEYLYRSDIVSFMPPAAVVLRPDVHMDKIDAISIATYAERIAEAMEAGLPLVLPVPDEVILPEELRPALPEPILLAPLSREILRAALDAWHPDVGVMADASLANRLPDDAAIAGLTPLALRLAFAAPGVEEALARLAQPAPQPVASGPHLDRIAGDNPALPAARRIVADLEDWQSGKIAWSDLTRSLLLYGPPGTGKTWLAQAMATSAGITHVSGSFAQWQAAGHLGNMLDAMRRCFAQAFAQAPAILTIDEIDAVGARDGSDSHARSYRTQVINAFLEQMDMISRKEGVIVVATCNHPGRIDPAILRAGRFDLHIELGPPGPAALAQILAGKLGAGFDPEAIAALARRASGCTPAQIDAAVRMARSISRAERRDLRLDDVRDALALPPQQDALDWRIAVHEAGHAVVCAALDLGEITRVTLTPRGGEIARNLPHHQMLLADYEAEIAHALAGRCAERLMLGHVSAGAGGGEESDLALATRIAVAIETAYGLGSDGPLWTGETAIGRLAPALQQRVRARLQHAETRATRILGAQRDQLDAIARDLQRRRHLSGEDLHRHLSGLYPGAP
ncbi:AAA family ATPase [Paracoccus sp. TOH]|uniref:AAA family ATPase n=1 Tax=Paracoccus sp. TOH TaxID=1263728 RepID=UPI0025B05D29|nr:AAA family ATPase [Paracoccus sp. TOH]WJS85315.1 AAA family ATPase [Paracoccus sp. TOH]